MNYVNSDYFSMSLKPPKPSLSNSSLPNLAKQSNEKVMGATFAGLTFNLAHKKS
jgi:hypothetical protein